MANIRLFQFPAKVNPVPADLIYCGDSAATFDEVNITIAQLINAYPNLSAYANIVLSANSFTYINNSSVLVDSTITPLAVTLLADSNTSQMQTTLGLLIGTNVEAWSAALDSIAGLTTVANNLIYTTALNTYAVITPANNSFLTTNGSGVPSWSPLSSMGTVTSIATNNGVTGGTITTTGTIGLAAIANNTVLANISGGSLFPSSTTLTALIDSAIGSTQGDILYRNASSWVVLAPGTAGQVLSTGGAAANPSWIAAGGTGTVTSISAGTGITLTPNPITTTGTIALTGNPGLVWSTVSGASQAMTANSGYNVNGGGVTTMSLPTSGAAQFSCIAIQNSNAGGTFQITQAVGQIVIFGNKLTTSGVGGSITSTAFGDYIYLWCFTANATWFVQGSIGNFTIV